MSARFTLSIRLPVDLLMSRPAKKSGLPAVTAYLVAGLLPGLFCIGSLGIANPGFSSLEQVSAYNVISQAVPGFIAFAIGNEFRLDQLRRMVRSAIIVGILQVVITIVLFSVLIYELVSPTLTKRALTPVGEIRPEGKTSARKKRLIT